MRRHGAGDARRIASSVLVATTGVVETQFRRTDETRLIRAIGGKSIQWQEKSYAHLLTLNMKEINCRGGASAVTQATLLNGSRNFKMGTKNWRRWSSHSERRERENHMEGEM